MTASFLVIKSTSADSLPLRQVETINRDWRFFHGDIPEATSAKFQDESWARIGLPHSFSIPYFQAKDFYIGYGWYRKTLDVPADRVSGKSFFLEFDGVFQEAEVFINGTKAGRHEGGYTGFSIDITREIRPGPNTIAIRVNNLWKPTLAPRAGEHVFSGGIYRNVRLVVTSDLHVAWCGTWVTTPKISAESATVNVKTEVANDSDNVRSCTLRTEILDPDGRKIAEIKSETWVPPRQTITLDQTSEPIAHPRLWSPESPKVYKLVSTILDQDKEVDRYETPFGMRWFEWTSDKGFFLNGKHYYLFGANVHQDHAGWGDAVTDAGARRDVRLVKEAGFNFIRGSHYPHSPTFSAACDQQGLLFLSENCFWSTGGSKNNGYWDSSGYPIRAEDEETFKESVRKSLREMIRIHRNHPSIAAWSMCNEVFFTTPETLPKARQFLKELVAYSHELDPSRAAAVGGCQRGNLHLLGDIAALNGDGASLPEFQNPGVPSLVSEYGSTMVDRPGDYAPGWGHLELGPGLDKNSKYPWRLPWRSGEAIWCAFDHGSIAGKRFGSMGILDYFRLPKRQWYWYRNEFRDIPPPPWPCPGTPAGLKIEADKTTLQGTDGTDDAHVIVTVVDAQGKELSNCVPVTLRIQSGPGEFPTGPSITFAPDSDIAIRDGKAAIEFRSYHAGETVIRATSPGLQSGTLRIKTEGTPLYMAGKTPDVQPRPYVQYVRKADPNAANLASEFGLSNPTRASGEVIGHSAPMANDGDKTTYWQSPGGTREAWWQVELERIVSINRIRLLFPADEERHYRIETSLDGVHWNCVLDRTQTPVSGRERPEEVAPGTTASTVRVTFTGLRPEQPATLTEMSISGRLASPCNP